MPSSHKHSTPPVANAGGSGSGGNGLPLQQSYEQTQQQQQQVQQQQPLMEYAQLTQYPGVRFYPPPMAGGALQLPNGDFIPYEIDGGVDHGLMSHQLGPPPMRLLVPGAYYAPTAGAGVPLQESMVSYDPTGGGGGGGRLAPIPITRNLVDESEKHVRGNKPRNRNGGRNRGGGGSSSRSRAVQKELKDNAKRTVYISDIDQQVTEEELANLFVDLGSVVDCRVCGDPNSAKRFAFIEFSDEEGATKALEKSGTTLGESTIKILPSKTAIVPVNKDFMPRNMEEMELCSRTVYIANIDKKVDKHDVRRFFESLCGKVTKLRLLGDYAHSTRIAFIEFTHADSALAALNCTGAVLGTLPIRVAPSKAPVRMCSNSDCED
eukprot:g541.t1